VPLGLVANGKQVLREGDGLAPEIIEVARYKDIFSAQVGVDVFRSMDTGPLDGLSSGIIIDAVAEALCHIGAAGIWYAVRPVCGGAPVVICQRHNLVDMHRIDKPATEIAAVLRVL